MQFICPLFRMVPLLGCKRYTGAVGGFLLLPSFVFFSWVTVFTFKSGTAPKMRTHSTAIIHLPGVVVFPKAAFT